MCWLCSGTANRVHTARYLYCVQHSEMLLWVVALNRACTNMSLLDVLQEHAMMNNGDRGNCSSIRNEAAVVVYCHEKPNTLWEAEQENCTVARKFKLSFFFYSECQSLAGFLWLGLWSVACSVICFLIEPTWLNIVVEWWTLLCLGCQMSRSWLGDGCSDRFFLSLWS